ncbi:fumarylacetoacetate hydrolase family protein [Mesorhizobium shangrilense]|uniref:Fumarylacetoacetate hydrolase family protein n=1 Tax=Mesorhizobium shangrilense TaxID=460060 RepID=A0ABV2DGW0_9HYPH
MKFLTYRLNEKFGVGILHGTEQFFDLGQDPSLPTDMIALIAGGDQTLSRVRKVVTQAGADSLQALSSIEIVAPIPRPSKNVFCVGRNYRGHIIEGARARGIEVNFPAVPEFFTKPVTSIVGPEAGIRRYQSLTSQLDYEVELAVVIGRKTRDVSVEQALSSVWGYTIINEISARDLQRAHGQWFKGKGLDTFCPMGPWIVTADEFGNPEGHRLSLTVNGGVRQASTTTDLLFSVAEIISHLSAGLTLEPGDIIATGTPSGVALGMSPQAWLEIDDVVAAEIDGIGVLRNRVIP